MKKLIILFLLSLLVAFGCRNNSQEGKMLPLQNDYPYVHLMPDSTATPEQLVLKYRLSEALAQHLTVKDGFLVFNLSKDGLVSMGIPEPYYNAIQNKVTEMNNVKRHNSNMNLDSLITENNKKIPDPYIVMTASRFFFNMPVQKMKIRIVNLSGDEISFGALYSIERSDGTEWQDVGLFGGKHPVAFHDILYTLQSDAVIDMEIYLYPEYIDYSPGLYRITKTFDTNKGKAEVACEFFFE